jgi:DNA-binding NarL/FixJ family response regulator
MASIRVLLADDHKLVLGAIEKLLAPPEFEVVGSVLDGRALIAAVEECRPDVIVTDLTMASLNGLDATREIRRKRPRMKIVLLTMNENPELVTAAFRAGASAFLLKRSAAEELPMAIREVMSGRSYVTPLATDGVVGLLQQDVPANPIPELTPRQREVLQLLAEGHSMKQVGDVLKVTPRTVAFHKYRMMSQLHIRSSAELIQYAVKLHLV